MLDARARLIRAAVGFALVAPTEPELRLLHRWLACWRGVGDVVFGMKRQGYEVGIGHAYERATDWHTCRPTLLPGATAPDVTPPPALSGGAEPVDAETRDLCAKSARREHGGVDYADLGNLTRACDLWGKTSVVRVMDNDYATIYRALDRGA